MYPPFPAQTGTDERGKGRVPLQSGVGATLPNNLYRASQVGQQNPSLHPIPFYDSTRGGGVNQDHLNQQVYHQPQYSNQYANWNYPKMNGVMNNPMEMNVNVNTLPNMTQMNQLNMSQYQQLQRQQINQLQNGASSPPQNQLQLNQNNQIQNQNQNLHLQNLQHPLNLVQSGISNNLNLVQSGISTNQHQHQIQNPHQPRQTQIQNQLINQLQQLLNQGQLPQNLQNSNSNLSQIQNQGDIKQDPQIHLQNLQNFQNQAQLQQQQQVPHQLSPNPSMVKLPSIKLPARQSVLRDLSDIALEKDEKKVSKRSPSITDDKKRRGRPKKLILDPSTNEYITSSHPNFKHLNKLLKEAESNQNGSTESNILKDETISKLNDQPTYLRKLDDDAVKQLLTKKDRRGRPRKFPVEQTGLTIRGIRVNGVKKKKLE